MGVGLQHNFVLYLKIGFRDSNSSLKVCSYYHEILLDRLDEHLGGQVGGDLPDVHVLGEGGAPGQVVLVDQLDQGLGRLVDHGIGHHAGLTEGAAQGEAGEDVPEV